MENPKPLTKSEVKSSHEAITEFLPDAEFVVIGTGSIAAMIDDTTSPLAKYARTHDLDFCVVNQPLKEEVKEQINHDLGEFSKFRGDNKYYIQVLSDVFISNLPNGWEDRSTKLKTTAGEFQALSTVDMTFNKLIACRGKDIEIVSSLIKDGIVDINTINSFVAEKEAFQKGLALQVSGALEAVDINLNKSNPDYPERVASFIEGNKEITPFIRGKLNKGVLCITLSELSPEDIVKFQNMEKDFNNGDISTSDFIAKSKSFSEKSEQQEKKFRYEHNGKSFIESGAVLPKWKAKELFDKTEKNPSLLDKWSPEAKKQAAKLPKDQSRER